MSKMTKMSKMSKKPKMSKILNGRPVSESVRLRNVELASQLKTFILDHAFKKLSHKINISQIDTFVITNIMGFAESYTPM
jgi:hypothetical protein